MSCLAPYTALGSRLSFLPASAHRLKLAPGYDSKLALASQTFDLRNDVAQVAAKVSLWQDNLCEGSTLLTCQTWQCLASNLPSLPVLGATALCHNSQSILPACYVLEPVELAAARATCAYCRVVVTCEGGMRTLFCLHDGASAPSEFACCGRCLPEAVAPAPKCGTRANKVVVAWTTRPCWVQQGTWLA